MGSESPCILWWNRRESSAAHFGKMNDDDEGVCVVSMHRPGRDENEGLE